MNRRTALLLLGTAGIAGVGSASVLLRDKRDLPVIPDHPSGRLAWTNWSGNQYCHPEHREAPADEDELRQIILKGNSPIRVVGAGHSFTGLVPTDMTLVSLDRMGGVKSVNLGTNSATMGAGGRLRNLSEELHDQGAAFPNLGDIDKQSLAGAVATATHGTGKSFSSMSGGLTQLKLMTANGEVLTCSQDQNTDLFKAAQVSIGALGILTEADVQIVPSFRLAHRTWVEPITTLLPRVMELIETHHTFEFFYLPFTDHCLCVANDLTDKPSTPIPESTDTEGLMSLKSLRDYFSAITPLRRRLGRGAMAEIESESFISDSWRVLSSERNVQFNEMEYHLPASTGLETLEKIIRKIERHHQDVFFPIEFRYVKADTPWLSPFVGRESISIAVHTYYKDDYSFLFSDIEPVFRAAGGRPHWGKLNSLTASDFEALYPRWNDFLRIRRELDPNGVFLNPYLTKVFGHANQ